MSNSFFRLLTNSLFLIIAALWANASQAQRSCVNNLACNAGEICNARKQCQSAPGMNGGGGGSGPSGPFSKPTSVTGTKVLQEGWSCLKSISKPAGCDKIPDQQTLAQLATDASKACLGKFDPQKGPLPSDADAAYKKCVDAAFDKLLTNLLNQTLGACLPIIKTLKTCVNASVSTLGYGFNELWCSTYPQDPFCTGGKPINQQVNQVIVDQCLDKSAKPSNAACFSCCMSAFDCENYRNAIGETKRSFCLGVENTCNKCNMR